MEFNSGKCVKNKYGYHLHYGYRMRDIDENTTIWIGSKNPTAMYHDAASNPNGTGVWIINHSDRGCGIDRAVLAPTKDGFKDKNEAMAWANKEYELS